MNFGPGYKLNYVIAKGACNYCDKELLAQVEVDSKPYSEQQPITSTEYSFYLQPDSGFASSSKKSYTVFADLSGSLLPFPSFSSKSFIPVFHVEETMQINSQIVT